MIPMAEKLENTGKENSPSLLEMKNVTVVGAGKSGKRKSWKLYFDYFGIISTN
jgi:hypothetical protein